MSYTSPEIAEVLARKQREAVQAHIAEKIAERRSEPITRTATIDYTTPNKVCVYGSLGDLNIATGIYNGETVQDAMDRKITNEGYVRVADWTPTDTGYTTIVELQA